MVWTVQVPGAALDRNADMVFFGLLDAYLGAEGINEKTDFLREPEKRGGTP